MDDCLTDIMNDVLVFLNASAGGAFYGVHLEEVLHGLLRLSR